MNLKKLAALQPKLKALQPLITALFAATPNGYGASMPNRFSTVAKETRRVAEGKAAVRQVWDLADGHDAIDRLFRVVLEGLEVDTTYELFVKANNLSRNTARISAFQLVPGPDGVQEIKRLSLEVIRAGPGKRFKQYAGRFTTLRLDNPVVLLTTSCYGQDFPATVIWDDWRLMEIKK